MNKNDKTHYYFSWFSNGLPKKIADLLHNDIANKKSLVTINTKPFGGCAISEEEYKMVALKSFNNWVQ